MRRIVSIAACIMAVTGVLLSPSIASAVKDGARCSKLNQKITVSQKIFQCKKVGKVLIWRYVGVAPAPKPTATPTRTPPSSPTASPSPIATKSPSPSPTQTAWIGTGLPASRLLASSVGLLGLVDRTSDASSWAQFYGTGLAFKNGFIRQGSTFTLSWHVVDKNGNPLKNTSVNLCVNKAYGQSNATFTDGSRTISSNGGSDGANLLANTDSSGNVSFTLTDISTSSEPYDVPTDKKDTYLNSVFGQFALLVNSLPQTSLSLDVVNIHVLANPPSSTPTPTPTQSALTEYLWAEEFNSTSGTLPTSRYWTPLIGDGFNQLGFYNYGTGEIESNSATAAATDGKGNLVITTRKTDGVWSSARIWTQGKVNFQYGKLEVRMKLPAGDFNWPAFWMLGSNYQPPNQNFGDTPWPNSGEIDIVEGLSNNSVLQSTIHANNLGATTPWNGGGGVTVVAPLANISGNFHTFGLLWKPGVLAFTLDGVEYGRNTFSGNKVIQTVNGNVTTIFDCGGVWPFDKPFFILLNNAVNPAAANLPDGTSSTTTVDWIRYSQYEGFGTLNP